MANQSFTFFFLFLALVTYLGDVSCSTAGGGPALVGALLRGVTRTGLPKANLNEDYFEGWELVEGDMLRPKVPDDMEAGAIEDFKTKLWPQVAPGVYEVPFSVDETLEDHQKMMIAWAMAYLERGSNVVFRQARSDDVDTIYIRPGGRCSSAVGASPSTRVTLGHQCFTPGTVAHELLHSLGFMHEQQRPDRGDHIEGLSEKLAKDVVNFGKNANGRTLTPYDYYSVMHYGTGYIVNGVMETNFRYTNATANDIADFKFNRHIMSSCDWRSLNAAYPGKKVGPKCSPYERPEFDTRPSLGLTAYGGRAWAEGLCQDGREFPISRECTLRSGTEFPPMSWLDEINLVKGYQVSDITRLRYCSKLSSSSRIKGRSCVRLCKYTCPRKHVDLTIPECLKTHYHSCVE